MIRRALYIVIASIALTPITIDEDYYSNATFSFSEISIDNFYSENGWIRRDPSDIIFFNGKYRVYFNLAERPGGVRTNADWNGIIGQWTSTDTDNWTETEAVLLTGGVGAVDEWGCVAPACVIDRDTLWLYYGGWGRESGEDSTYAPNKIVYSLRAWSVDGNNFTKTTDTIISIHNPGCFTRIGDQCLVWFKDTLRNYHKSVVSGESHSRMAVTTSTSYRGEFTQNCTPVLPIGHENIIFKAGQYLYGIIPDTYNTGETYIYVSEDGLNWTEKAGPFNSTTESPYAGSIYKSEAQFKEGNPEPPVWGFTHQPDLNSNTRLNCLRKWTINLNN